MLPNAQGLDTIAGEPYEQFIGQGGISSADGTVVLAQTGGVIDLSAKVALNALLTAIKTAVAGSGSSDSALLAAVAAIAAQ